LWAVVCLVALSGTVFAQELDPRAYQPAPIGLNAFIVGYTNSSGNVVFDPSLPVKDVHANLNFGSAAYYRTFGMFGRFANITVALPYADGHMRGVLETGGLEIYRSGLGDGRFRIACNIIGTPAAKPGEFVKKVKHTNVGISLTTSVPTGQYDSNKFINIGQNRWAFKPEIGLSRISSKWQFDAYAGAWFFTANNDFRHQTQTQDPIASFQFHLTYNIRHNFWMGVNTNFYSGGRTATDGVVSPVQQKNSRIGATVALPIARNQTLKVAVSRGVIVTRGGDFTTVGTSYSYIW